MLVFLFIISICATDPINEISAKYYHENKNNVYVHKNTSEKIVALTFDDGPHPQKTERILNILSKYNVKATFFVIGENAQQYPDVLKKTADLGHEIGNHTYDHKSVYKLQNDELVRSVIRCEKLIQSITEKKPSAFRPPEGYMNDEIANSMNELGYNVFLWRIDTYDWKGRDAYAIYNTVINSVCCGDIILMHD